MSSKDYTIDNGSDKLRSFNLQVITTGRYTTFKYYKSNFDIPDNNGNRGIRGLSTNPQKSLDESIRIAKRNLYGLILSNDWEYWATQTFDSKKVDRYNLDAIQKKYNQKLYNLRKTNYPNLKWVIIPELHEDKAWHMHMFMSGIPKDEIIYSGHNYYNKKHQFVRRIYNWQATIEFGYNDYLDISDCDVIEKRKISNYCTKYITKQFAAARFNKKKYWATRGLYKPEMSNILLDEKTLYDHYQFVTNDNDNLIITTNDYYIKSNITNKIYNDVKELTILTKEG